MKSLYLVTISVLLFFSGYKISENDTYYWYNGKKIPLKVQSGKNYVVFADNPNALQLGKTIAIKKFKFSSSIKELKEAHKKEIFWAVVSDAEKDIIPTTSIIYQTNFYANDQGKEAGLSQLFYVKLKNETDAELLNAMARKNGVTVIGNNKLMPLWYTLSCDKNSKGNALTMANLFYESGNFRASQPDLMENKLLCASDPYFSNQWGLKNTGQYSGTIGVDIDLCRAWEISRGCSSITVAVLDQGFELDHPDLTNLSSSSFDTGTGTSPSFVYGEHATAVAGIIGATQNNIGVTGVAPGAQLMSVSQSLYFAPNTTYELALGLSYAWQNGADVINNSWGSDLLQSTYIDDAIYDATHLGRGGLGTVVVFATGNANTNGISYPSTNADVLAVGAISMCGQRKSPSSCDAESWGSNYGTGLDVVAPGVKIYTTDQQSSNGYASGDYFASFNGTSSAAPHVAGIAALVLSVNPLLTQAQVRDIIESSVDKTGSYTYTSGTGENTALTWNNEMGYGKVNAYKALKLTVGDISGPGTICGTTSFSIPTNISGLTGVAWSVTGPYSISGSASGTSVNIISTGNGTPGVLSATLYTACGSIVVKKEISGVGLQITPSLYNGVCGEATVEVTATGGSYAWIVTGDLVINGTSATTLTTSTNSITVSGTLGDIFVTVTGVCGSTINLNSSYRPYPTANIGFSSYLPLLPADQLSAYLTSHDATHITNYRWYVNGTLVYSGPSDSYCTCYYYGPDTRVCGNNSIVIEADLDCGGSYVIASNEFEQLCGGWYRYYVVYPNPGNEFIYVGPSEEKMKTISPFEKKQLGEYQATLYNKAGKVLVKTRSKDGKVNIPVGNIPSDTYFLHLQKDGDKEIIKRQVIVKH